MFNNILINKKEKKLKRFLDLIISIILLFLLFFPCLLICLVIFLDSKGPIFYKTNRIGKNKKIFRMYKFRTMKITAPVIDTNQFQNPDKYITKFGKNLRKYKKLY